MKNKKQSKPKTRRIVIEGKLQVTSKEYQFCQALMFLAKQNDN